MSIGFAIGFSVVALVVGISSVILGAWAIIEVQAFKRSTHQIQYMPIEQALDNAKSNEDIMRESMDWADNNPKMPMQEEVM